MFDNVDFFNKKAWLSIEKFNSISKYRKPKSDEWTILSCILKYNKYNDSLEVVSLGTGSKCIGVSKMSANGDILNDSHAEIINRRAFLRYLYNEIIKSLNNDPKSIFLMVENKFHLKDSISFHFFTTHVPCGDAAIFPKDTFDDVGECLTMCKNSGKRKLEEDDSQCKKKLKVEDIFRTGAKCLENEEKQDSKLSGINYHTLGAVRTKPGRGDPTLSVSCSDKFAKWTFLGVQGCLLSFLLSSPIYFSSFTIAAGTPFSKEAFLRAVSTRFCFDESFQQKIPIIGQSTVSFEFSKDKLKRPCSSSIIWCNVSEKPLEVSVDGKKQGVTKKNQNKKEARLLICKKELFAMFRNIIIKFPQLNLQNLSSLSYKDVKNKSDYYKLWNVIKSKVFSIWTVKNENLLNFTEID